MTKPLISDEGKWRITPKGIVMVILRERFPQISFKDCEEAAAQIAEEAFAAVRQRIAERLRSEGSLHFAARLEEGDLE